MTVSAFVVFPPKLLNGCNNSIVMTGLIHETYKVISTVYISFLLSATFNLSQDALLVRWFRASMSAKKKKYSCALLSFNLHPVVGRGRDWEDMGVTTVDVEAEDTSGTTVVVLLLSVSKQESETLYNVIARFN